ncbi:MAG: GIY-YIG nuclease family protein [bacterium]|nr:GIY-YIG nuclease family protein [bacterium]
MRYVYLLRSQTDPSKRYVGITTNPARRLEEHNSGKSYHTSKYRPWVFTAIIQMQDDIRAEELEKYLKSGSGRAFANRHLW